MPTTLDLTEYRTLEGVALTHEQRLALRDVFPSLSVRASSLGDGLFDLTPSSVVGVAKVGDLSLHVSPKFGIPSLAFMLAYSIGRIHWSADDFAFDSDATLTELIIPGFVTALAAALGPGVLQGYRVEEDSSSTVRGRIRFDDQLRRRYGLAPPVELRFDEFTEDIEENRLLRAALHRVSKMSLSNEDHRRALRVFAAALRNVTRVDYDPRRIPSPQVHRLNARYEQALLMARLILRSTAIEVEAGGIVSSAFTVDMNDVFEDFVVRALRSALGLTERAFPQNAAGRKLRFDAADRIRLKPDISWWEMNRCVMVGDVKYKRTDDAIKHPDLYQLNAYAVATGLPGGMLIYAAGEAEPTTHVVRNSNKTLLIRVLDVSGEPASVLAQVEELATEVSGLRERAYQPFAPTG